MPSVNAIQKASSHWIICYRSSEAARSDAAVPTVRSRLCKFRLNLIDQLSKANHVTTRQRRPRSARSPRWPSSFALIQLLTRPLRYDRSRRFYTVLSSPMQRRTYAASLANSTGSMIEGSSFSGLFTRLDIGHIRIRPAGNGRIRSRGSGSSLNHRV